MMDIDLKKQKATRTKNLIIRIIMAFLVVAALVMLFLLFKNQIVQIIKLAKEGKDDELADFLNEKGIMGTFLIILLEAIQMVVVFIPAEFVQISAGVSYPIWYAILICMAGVVLGASIIYFLVNVLKYEGRASKKANNQLGAIERTQKKKRNAQILMYILFIMPAIPFGAICYYGSNKKVPFHKYIFTCATGVIPSIATSWVMGNVGKNVYINNPKNVVWVVLIVVFLAFLLLFTLGFILKKIFFSEDVGKYTPNALYSVFRVISNILVRTTRRVVYNRDRCDEIVGPCVILVNHQSNLDVGLIVNFLKDYELTVVANNHYARTLWGRLAKKNLKFIYKKLFYADLDAVKNIIGAIKQDRYLLLFPEGRLTTDGDYMDSINDTAKLLKKLNAQLVFINIQGNYFIRPKWSIKKRRGQTSVFIRDIINPDKLETMTVDEIRVAMDTNLKVDDYQYIKDNNLHYKSKDMTLGLDGILYKCPHCEKEFKLSTYKNHIKCNACGYEVMLTNKYEFKYEMSFSKLNRDKKDIKTIIDWNNFQKEALKKELDNIDDYKFSCDVNVIRYDNRIKYLDIKGEGLFTIDKEGYTFEGFLMAIEESEKILARLNNKKPKNRVRKYYKFTIPFDRIEGIPFSSIDNEFELYYNGKLYYLYPSIKVSGLCAKISLIGDYFRDRYYLQNKQSENNS